MEVTSRVEQELERYRASNPEEMTAKCLLLMWEQCKWKPNGPHQVFWIDAALRMDHVLVCSVPRAGKDMCLEAADLYEMVMNPFEDLRFYAPKLDQGKEVLMYHYNWIDKSPLLKAFLRRRNGKPIFSTETYEFANLSNAKIYSIRGDIEGHNVSIARVIEFDDWEWEVFGNAVMRRMGAAAKNERAKRVRISGTIQGEENIFRVTHQDDLKKIFKDLSQHPSMGPIDIHLLLSFGTVMDPIAVELQKGLMTDDEWARSMLLRYTESKNFIKRKYLRAIQKKANQWGLEAEKYEEGGRYRKKPGTTIAVGLDCGHGGDKEKSSKYSLQFEEEIRVGGMRYRRWLNGFNWSGTTSEQTLIKEICERISFYKPDGGHGDALGMHLIAAVNRKLYQMGVTSIDIDEFPENKPGDWEKWYIIPMWNSDAAKHEMYTGLQMGIHGGWMFFPYYDQKDASEEGQACHQLLNQIEGIKQTVTGGKYPSYACESKKVGDDDSDALGMADRWINLHGPQEVDWGLYKRTGAGRVFNSGSILGQLKGIMGR